MEVKEKIRVNYQFRDLRFMVLAISIIIIIYYSSKICSIKDPNMPGHL